MICRIEIFPVVYDARAKVRKKWLESLGFENKIRNVSIADIYTIEKDLSKEELYSISLMLSNPVTQKPSIRTEENKKDYPRNFDFDYAIETGFLPGVTDNIGNTAKEAIEDLLKIKFDQDENVYVSQITYIFGKISKKEIDQIAQSMINPLIQRAHVKDSKSYKENYEMDFIVPRVKLGRREKILKVDLNIDDEKLKDIGKFGIEDKNGTRRGPLALDLIYMKTIQKHFNKLGRNPTDIEIESIAQTWSEHCKHTIFADPIDEIKEGLFKTYIKRATDEIRKKKGKNDFCVAVFKDNSGAIEFDKDFLVTHKVETHNSPSALDPFGGSITGIVGVNRDAIGFGLGAKPIINTYGFCLAELNDQKELYKNQNLSQKMLEPRRIMDGVIAGVNSGGNCSGIPTPQGFVYFHPGYRAKPSIFVGTLGLIPKKIGKQLSYKKQAKPGDLIVVIGGRVGLDGIHGATFSSENLDSGSPATAVQIGDPITQKKLSDVVVKEARDLNLYNSITDNGAGGISCSVAEMAKESGGCIVDLEKVPLKYPGLSPWQIWISESQERMTLAVPKNKWQKFYTLMKKRGVEATIIGKFTNSGKCVVKYKNQKIMDLDMKFLHDGLPKREMYTAIPQIEHQEPDIKKISNLTKNLLKMLKRPNITSFDFISSQYDHEVQGGSLLKPLHGRGRINSEVTVFRPILNSSKAVIISQGLYPNYSEIDTYHMAAASIDTAVRNIVAAGGNLDKLALLDNFCWCSSNDSDRLFQLKQAVKACYDCAVSFETPYISGKDSMFNDFKGFDEQGKPVKISIPPTLLISSLGIIDDVSKVVSLDVKFPEDLIYILGETNEELGGSEYYAMFGFMGKSIPKVDASKNKKLYKAFNKCIEKELISSSISVARGGFAVAFSKMAMGGMLGIEISLKSLPGKLSRDDFALFSESQGRILVSINPENKKAFEKIMKDISFAQIGKVRENGKFIIKGLNGKTIIDTDVKELLKAYKSTFKDY